MFYENFFDEIIKVNEPDFERYELEALGINTDTYAVWNEDFEDYNERVYS